MQIASRLSDPRYAALVAARVELDYGGHWHEVFVSSVGSRTNRHYEGMSVADIAQATGRPPVAAALRLLVDEKLDVSAIYFTMCEDDVRTVLSYQHTTIGSDASVRAIEGITSRGQATPTRVWDLPANFQTLRARHGAALFDGGGAPGNLPRCAPARLARARHPRTRDTLQTLWSSTPSRSPTQPPMKSPTAMPDGIVHVFVNGKAVVRNAAVTGIRSGRVLRRGRDL